MSQCCKKVNTYLAAAAAAIFIAIALSGCSITIGSQENIAHHLLFNQWGGHSNTLDYDMMYATGHPNSIGSDQFPGTIQTTTADNGAHIITITVPATPQGQLWNSGNITFTYWISQDGNYMRPMNNNASVLDGYDGEILNP